MAEDGGCVVTVGGACTPSCVSHLLGQQRCCDMEILRESYGIKNGSSFPCLGSPLHKSSTQQTPSSPPSGLLTLPSSS